MSHTEHDDLIKRAAKLVSKEIELPIGKPSQKKTRKYIFQGIENKLSASIRERTKHQGKSVKFPEPKGILIDETGKIREEFLSVIVDAFEKQEQKKKKGKE